MLDAYFPTGYAHFFYGGLLMGLGVALLYASSGRLGGASTFFSAIWSHLIASDFFRQARFVNSRNWRTVYALGMLLGGLIYAGLDLPRLVTEVAHWKFIVGGLFIGFGARLGGGCTSGHGICGMASLSLPSMTMVITFLTSAIITAQVVSALGF